MNALRPMMILLTAVLVAACGDPATEEQMATAVDDAVPAGITAKPEGPVRIDYRIIGVPIVGQPLAIDIAVSSLLGPQQVEVEYRISDSTAMELTEAQPARVSVAPTSSTEPSVQQVRLVPLREGRSFLNVAASVEVEGGRLSSVIAIPIQVGAAPRQPEVNGTLTTDDSGEPIHSLPATEN